MKKLIWLLVSLLFVPVISWGQVHINPIVSDAVANNTDQSVHYLSQIFGDVGHVLHGSSGSMMAHLFGQFNLGVIVIAAFVLGYGVVQNVLRTISETAFMSANRNTATMVLRIALGFSVLIPLGSYTNGYNASQVLLMEVVKSGVSLADVTWDATLKTWKNQQGQILQQPAVSTKNKDKILNKNFTDKLLTVDQPYLASEIDSDLNTYNSNIKLGDDSASGLKTISDGDLTELSFLQKMFEVNVCLYKRRLDTSNFALTSSYSSSERKINYPSSTTDSDGCGSIDVSDVAKKLYSDYSGDPKKQNIYIAATVPFINELSSNFTQAAQTYVCSLSNYRTKPSCRGVFARLSVDQNSEFSVAQKAIGQSLESSFIQYVQEIKKAQESGLDYALAQSRDAAQRLSDNLRKGSDASDDPMSTAVYGRASDISSRVAQDYQNQLDNRKSIYDEFIKQSKAEGWALAGAHYWSMIRVHDQAKANIDYASHVDSNSIDAQNAIEKITEDPSIDDQKLGEDLVYGSAMSVWYINNVMKAAGAGATADPSSASNVSVNMGLGLLGTVLPFTAPISDIGLIISKFSTQNMNADPVIWLSGLGSLFINLAGDLVFTFMLTGIAALGLFSVGNGWLNFQPAISGGIDWFRPIVFLAATMFVALGITLQYMVPLYPFMVFTFGVISWLAMVIEAMAAMPLVALGLTHPEGHDFLGKAEQAMMLLLGVFLRPVLMIIGLVAGMILAQVSLKFVIWAYSLFIRDLFSLDLSNRSAVGSGFIADPLATASHVAFTSFASQSYGPYGGVLRIFIIFPVVFFIFADLVYQVVKTCYNLIFILPDYVLRWIGGPQQASAISPVKLSQGVTGAVESGSKQMVDQMKAAIDNYRQTRALDDGKISGISNSVDTNSGDANDDNNEEDDTGTPTPTDTPNSPDGGSGGGAAATATNDYSDLFGESNTDLFTKPKTELKQFTDAELWGDDVMVQEYSATNQNNDESTDVYDPTGEVTGNPFADESSFGDGKD